MEAEAGVRNPKTYHYSAYTLPKVEAFLFPELKRAISACRPVERGPDSPVTQFIGMNGTLEIRLCEGSDKNANQNQISMDAYARGGTVWAVVQPLHNSFIYSITL